MVRDESEIDASAGATSSLESQARGLSPEDMRATWSVVDVLTSLKRRTSHPPTAALIRRKIDALSLPARDTLGFLVDFTIAETQGQLSPRQVGGMALAVRRYPDDTATEVAHVHARCEVVSAAAVEAVRFESSHLLRLGIESLTVAREHGIHLAPVATDRHAKAVAVLAEGKQGSEKAALEIMGVGDAVVLKGLNLFASSRGLLTGAAFCVAVMKRLDKIGCGRCRRVVNVAEISICSRCGDQLVCKACLVGGGCCARHGDECERVRGLVRAMAQSLIPSLRESARHVAVVQLDARGNMVPMHISSIGSPLTPSSLLESISRCFTIVTPTDAVVYWRLLVAFLADPDGDKQVSVIRHEDYRYYVKPAEHALEVDTQPAGPARRAPTHLSEKRRLWKGLKLAERKAKDDARAAAESVAMTEANAVLERQSARVDATSAMLTSVLAKREGVASPVVVARVRVKRDWLKAAERMARKAAKAKPERNLAERVRRDGDLSNSRGAAALLLQRHTRTWLRCRKKRRLKRRSRAAKLIQRSVRTWLLPRVVVKPFVAITATSSGSEGADGEEPEPPKPEPLASTEPTTTECTICLDDDADYAAVPCGHRCLCFNCSKTVSQCPMCRTTISAVLRVFV